jgi:hypothetical protein
MEMLRKRSALADPAYWQTYLDAGILVHAPDVSDMFTGDASYAVLERRGSDRLVVPVSRWDVSAWTSWSKRV